MTNSRSGNSIFKKSVCFRAVFTVCSQCGSDWCELWLLLQLHQFRLLLWMKLPLSLWGKAMERWYLQSLEYGLWGKIIQIHKPLSTGNEHNVKTWNFTKFIHSEGWIVSLFACLWANKIPHVQTILQLKPYAEIFVAVSFPCKNQHRFYCKPAHCPFCSASDVALESFIRQSSTVEGLIISPEGMSSNK